VSFVRKKSDAALVFNELPTAIIDITIMKELAGDKID